MSAGFNRRCLAHQLVIDAAAAYVRLHPGAGEDEVIGHIPHRDTPDNRMLVRSALPVRHAAEPCGSFAPKPGHPYVCANCGFMKASHR